jgi:hypothetical protein
MVELVHLAQGGGARDGEAQEAADLHRPAGKPVKRLAAVVLQHQPAPIVFPHRLQRPRGPCTIKLAFQATFVRETIEAGKWRVLGDGQHSRHGVPAAVGARAPPSATEDAFAFHPRDLQAVIPLSTVPKGRVQLAAPAVERMLALGGASLSWKVADPGNFAAYRTPRPARNRAPPCGEPVSMGRLAGLRDLGIGTSSEG